MLFVFGLAIFTGAALLFWIQPMFARFLLPQLGGSPAVWNTAMVFYQAALLAGYLYAHLLSQKLGPRRAALFHCAVVLLPLLVLPLGLSENLSPPTASNPIPWMLSVMALAVGAPFFAVSATSPLLQRWFSSTDHPAARDPYFLYAASNAGSLLALISYPLLFEPSFDLTTQSRLWSWGYGVLIALIFTCAALLIRAGKNQKQNLQPEEKSKTLSTEKISASRRLRWILLALVPSSWMLSVTTYLTTDIAAIPLLWIIPLTLYLLTFIFAFASRPVVPHAWVVRLFPIVLLPLLLILAAGSNHPLLLILSFHLVVFFVAALACHGALAEDRPAPQNLTEFYLCLSIGGVLGGTFNALLAPLIFPNLTEYAIIIVLGAWLALPKPKKTNADDRVLDFALPAIVGSCCGIIIVLLQRYHYTQDWHVLGLMFGLPAFAAFSFTRRPLRFALAIAAIFLAANLRRADDTQTILTKRSFFGVVKVVKADTATGTYHRLLHGSTLHGLQSLDPKRAREPLTYYTRSGPLGSTIGALEQLYGDNFKTVGAVGLGTGTAAAYAKPHQRWTFYEIDPLVENIARDPRYFTYLEKCAAPFSIVLGDGRLQIKNAPDGSYDLLILDAYSSDALPVHLLTREALEIYRSKLSERGVMIFNISNRHLDIEPLMAALASELNLQALGFDDLQPDYDESQRGKTASQWVAMARRKEDFGTMTRNPRWQPLRSDPKVRAWTDSYSSLLAVFKWK